MHLNVCVSVLVSQSRGPDLLQGFDESREEVRHPAPDLGAAVPQSSLVQKRHLHTGGRQYIPSKHALDIVCNYYSNNTPNQIKGWSLGIMAFTQWSFVHVYLLKSLLYRLIGQNGVAGCMRILIDFIFYSLDK